MKKSLLTGLLALFVFTLTGYQAEAQQGQGRRRDRNQALSVLEGTWNHDNDIMKYSYVFTRDGSYQLWGILRQLGKDNRPDYEGKVTTRGSDITFEKLPSNWGMTTFEFEVDGDYLILADKTPGKRFPVTSSGSRTQQYLRNGATTLEFEVSQVGGSSRNGTTTDIQIKFPAVRGSPARDLEEDDVYIAPGITASSAGEAEVDGDITIERARDGSVTATVPIYVSKAGFVRVYIVKPGIKLTSKTCSVYADTKAPPQRRRGAGRAGPQQSAPTPPPPPPSRGNQLTESDIKLDEFQGRGIGADFTIKVKCINGETPERYTPMDKVSGYQVELAPLTRNFPRDPERADWKSMEVAFKGNNASGNRISSANDSWGFRVTGNVRANVYGRRANPADQPIVIRVRARTSDSRSAPWGDWVYLTGDGKGY